MNFCNFVQENLLKLLIITLLITILVLVIIHRYDKCKVKEGLDDDDDKDKDNDNEDNNSSGFPLWGVMLIAGVGLILLSIIVFALRKYFKKKNPAQSLSAGDNEESQFDQAWREADKALRTNQANSDTLSQSFTTFDKDPEDELRRLQEQWATEHES